jgi:hypothetical protein
MTSDRAKLLLDEQSFQGLLAAAFTIQEHNDRKRSTSQDQFHSDPVRETEAPGPAQLLELESPLELKSAPTCSQCGSPLSTEGSACSACSTASLRPGERLQRNWASMWLMSQDQHFWSEPRQDGPDGLPLSPGDPGRVRLTPTDAVRSRTESQTPSTGSLRIQEVGDDLASQQALTIRHSGARSLRSDAQEDRDAAGARDFLPDEYDDWPQVSGDGPNLENAEPPDSPPALSLDSHHDLVGETEELPSATDSADGSLQPGFWDLRVKLRFHRADLYLGIAILVAVTAVLWPSAGAQEPRLNTWERILVAAGIAEDPASHPVAVHFHGDPDLKVWVDTHTALYYCPGDDLYGKSAGGHYTTQREAQSDRFEPAERSVCIE